ncbi:hypothetical protein GCM10011371_15130 [Novosphingobium marinum]|uniref:DUF2497 domain-containing protein n=1 Tax=Novosphingobium marinum TaxID=1514948 RepID=A0A7Y9XZ65_9SPHN|nr:DUF2497 domain-containing protein [Novosphingobium marinum]NYH95626.1 hypothetical protein [Novosphingobium marinum]GGC28550.1 hypothetical protein GCM10011371_15130 [Novosphingobium marinum]
MRQASEPSVEEILESIKQVIARDNRVGALEERRRREISGVPGDEVESDDVLDLALDAELVPGDENFDNDGEDDATSPLLAEDAQASMRESLAALAMLSTPGAQPQIVRSGETSLEGLVREMLRPALAEWLDKNLPPLVERMVATEIKRIVGKKD